MSRETTAPQVDKLLAVIEGNNANLRRVMQERATALATIQLLREFSPFDRRAHNPAGNPRTSSAYKHAFECGYFGRRHPSAYSMSDYQRASVAGYIAGRHAFQEDLKAVLETTDLQTPKGGPASE